MLRCFFLSSFFSPGDYLLTLRKVLTNGQTKTRPDQVASLYSVDSTQERPMVHRHVARLVKTKYRRSRLHGGEVIQAGFVREGGPLANHGS